MNRKDPLRDMLDGGAVGRAMRDLERSRRLERELALGSTRFSDLAMGRPDRTAIGRTMADMEKTIAAAGGFGAISRNAALASGVVQSAGGIDSILKRHAEMETSIAAAGGLVAMAKRQSAMENAISAMGGLNAIMKRQDVLNDALTGVGTLRAARKQGFVADQVLAASTAADQALRSIAGVTAFTGLLDRATLTRDHFDTMISGTLAWRDAAAGLSLSSSLHRTLPELFPERRRATAADIAGADLSTIGSRFMRDMARSDRLRDEMLGLRRHWVDVENPGRSVAAYVEARALATVVEASPAESRAVVDAVRAELGDYREAEPVPEVVAADPMLRSAFRLEHGYNPDLSSLPPAVIAMIFSSFGGSVPRKLEADPDALESAVHQRARRLELKIRRFIEKRMMAVAGPKWSKQRVNGEVVTGWRRRRQIDSDNQRAPSRLFDYAGFEDYRAIIDRTDNWNDMFAAVFPVKTSILETLRRLSLIRNPDAHFRVVTIEDFVDLVVEGRRIDKWIDAAD